MSEHTPRLVRSEKRAVLFEECSHDEAVTADGTHVSFSILRDKGNGVIYYSEWLDTEENRQYIEGTNGELCYCRLAEVRGPELGPEEPPTIPGPLTITEPPALVKTPPVVTFVNYDGEEVVVHPGDRIEVSINDEGMARVSKL